MFLISSLQVVVQYEGENRQDIASGMIECLLKLENLSSLYRRKRNKKAIQKYLEDAHSATSIRSMVKGLLHACLLYPYYDPCHEFKLDFDTVWTTQESKKREPAAVSVSETA